jgi:hypothetical protein
VEDKDNLVAKVGRVSAPVVIDLLAVVLRGQQPHGTGSHKIGIRNLENMPDPLIIEDGPPDSTNPGSAVGAIEPFDADVGLGRRLNEVIKAVGDTSCSSPVNQDIKGIRVKQGSMCHGWARVITVSLSTSHSHGDGRENDSCGMVAGPGLLAPREGSRGRTERTSTRTATTEISVLDMDVGCYERSKVLKGGVGDLEPRLEPLRTSRALALGNIGIGQGF